MDTVETETTVETVAVNEQNTGTEAKVIDDRVDPAAALLPDPTPEEYGAAEGRHPRITSSS